MKRQYETVQLKVLKQPKDTRTPAQIEHDRWQQAEESWKITRREMCQRVRVLRDELEAYGEQLEGVPFDIASGDMCTPNSLDSSSRKYLIELVEELDPRVNGAFEMIDDLAKKHGLHELLDFNAKLFGLKTSAAHTGFNIGVLAGVILAGCPKEQVDRFERGLSFDLTRDHGGLVKA